MKRKLALGLSAISLSSLSLPAFAVNLVQNPDFSTTPGGVAHSYMVTSSNPAYNACNGCNRVGPIPDWNESSGYTWVVTAGTSATTQINPNGTNGQRWAIWPANGSATTVNTPTGSGWFLVQDSGVAANEGTLSQTLNNLVVGDDYIVSFWQAAGQLNDVSTGVAPVTYWEASIGGSIGPADIGVSNPEGVFYSDKMAIATKGNIGSQTYDQNWKAATGIAVSDNIHTTTTLSPQISGSTWEKQQFHFKATSTSTLLGFRPIGNADVPPVGLLSGIEVVQDVPEPTNFLAVATVVGLFGASRLYKKSKASK